MFDCLRPQYSSGEDLSRKTFVWWELNGASSIIMTGYEFLACVLGGPLPASISQWHLFSEEDTTRCDFSSTKWHIFLREMAGETTWCISCQFHAPWWTSAFKHKMRDKQVRTTYNAMTYGEGIKHTILGCRLKTVSWDDCRPRRAGAVVRSCVTVETLGVYHAHSLCVFRLSLRLWTVLKRRGYQIRRRQSTDAWGAHGVLETPLLLWLPPAPCSSEQDGYFIWPRWCSVSRGKHDMILLFSVFAVLGTLFVLCRLVLLSLLHCHWRRTPQSGAEICNGHRWCGVSLENAAWSFVRPSAISWSMVRVLPARERWVETPFRVYPLYIHGILRHRQSTILSVESKVCSLAIVWGGWEEKKTEARDEHEHPHSRQTCAWVMAAAILCSSPLFPTTPHDFCVFSSYHD